MSFIDTISALTIEDNLKGLLLIIGVELVSTAQLESNNYALVGSDGRAAFNKIVSLMDKFSFAYLSKSNRPFNISQTGFVNLKQQLYDLAVDYVDNFGYD